MMKGVRIRLDAVIMRVICVANQKGGVAKTATTAILASILTQRGYRVLAIDMDPQGSLSKQVSAEPGGHEVYDVLKGNISAREAIQPLTQFHILPTSIVLAGLEAELMTDMGKYFKLRDAIEKAQLGELYDYIIIDTPPSLGVPTVNAIVAADDVLVPIMNMFEHDQAAIRNQMALRKLIIFTHDSAYQETGCYEAHG